MTNPSHTELAARELITAYVARFRVPGRGLVGPIDEAVEALAAALESPTPPERVQGEARIKELLASTEPFVKLFQQADAKRDQPMDGNANIDAQIAVKDLRRLVYATADVRGSTPPTAPAQAPQAATAGAAIQWTLNGDKTCGYNNWVGETPFGRILITWKGWKEHLDASVDEFPGEIPRLCGDPEWVKNEAEALYSRRLSAALRASTPAERVPLTDDEILEIGQTLGERVPGVSDYTSWPGLGFRKDDDGEYTIPQVPDVATEFARRIERAHGIVTKESST